MLVNEELGTILPAFSGHFVEHLGAVVYDGIWVGEGSKVANVGGIRKSIVDHLARIKSPVIRYPGGCFADSYNWRDGIGERSKRPRRTNFWYGAEYCNAPPASATLANLRASGSAGSREPFRVEFWGIGNESWGCGGEMTPEEYSQEFRKFTAAYPPFDVPLKFIGAVGNRT